jgi:Xaa-Pro aminopeptidase
MTLWSRMVRIGFVLSTVVALSLGQDLKYIEYDTDLIPGSVYKERRERLMRELGEDAVAVFYSAPVRTRNWDVEYEYRQDDNLYYLTGFPEPNCVLVLVPRGVQVRSADDTTQMVTVKEVFFVQPKNQLRETWDGRRYGPAGAMKLRGLEHAVNNDQLRTMMGLLVFQSRPKSLYIPTFKSDLTGEIAELLQPVRSLLERTSSQIELRDPTPTVRRMRIVKGPEEIALLTKATEISALAHNQAMMSVEPGMKEYELGAVYEYVFRKSGAQYSGYPCIVGSRENTVILHYNTNRRAIQNGDLVLADCAAEYHGYSSDITRTYPANGTFSKPQRAIYQIVLDAQKAAIAGVKPGVAWSDVSAIADSVMMDGLMKLGLLKNRSRQELRRFTLHGLGHPVGLNVHDVGQPIMEEGMVYTVEPGIYISEEFSDVDSAYHNIGVRIEDVILVTKDGTRLLSAGSPREIAEIEALMKKRGIGNQPLR